MTILYELTGYMSELVLKRVDYGISRVRTIQSLNPMIPNFEP